MMRSCLFLLLLCLCVTCIFAQTPPKSNGLYSSQITFSRKNVTLEKIISVIEEQSNYVVFYPQEELKKAGRISVSVKNATVQEFLNICLANQPFTFNVDDLSIGLEYEPGFKPIEKEVTRPTFKTIRGRVVNRGDSAIVGATISVGSAKSTFSASADGRFKISIPVTARELEISSINYIPQVIILPRSGVDLGSVILAEKPISEEKNYVVVGYGTQKKSDLTSSISSITSIDIGDRVDPTIYPSIVGKTTGLDISGQNIRIRGTTSFSYTEPLVVIDGFLGGSISNINPNDITGIEILKDAAGTSIYGARGANGVILISTKSGKKGDLKCNITSFAGFASTTKRLDVLNAEQYVQFYKDAMKNANQPLTAKLKGEDVKVTRTNWQDEVFRNGNIREIDVDFSGGSDKANYFFSAGFRHDEGITIGPSADNIYLGLRNDFKVKRWFRAGDNLAFSYKVSRGAAPWDVKSVINMPPYFEVKDPKNYWGYSAIDRNEDLGDNLNPVAISALTHPMLATLGYNANLWAEIEPMAGLVYRVQAGISGFNSQSKIWNDRYSVASAVVPNNYAEKSAYSIFPIVESYLTYKKVLSRHDFSFMIGNSWQDGAQTGGIGIAGQDYALTTVPNVFNAATRYITTEDYTRQSFLSYFGRINYQFNNRYLLNINVRRDGSPRFAPSHRWATFPSVAVGWKMQDVPFIKNLDLFNEFKVRFSYGAAGNDGIGDFKYVSPVWTNGVYYPFGATQTLNSGATVVENSSQDIRWETTISKTFGLDMAFHRNALQISAEYFVKDTRDILFTVPRAASLGYGLPPYGGDATVNAASCINEGFEFQVRYRGKIGKLKYALNGNFTSIKNRVTSLGLGQPYLAGVNKTSIGNPIAYFYGYVADGVFMEQADVNNANDKARKEALAANSTLNTTQLSEIFYQDPSTRAGDIRFKDINGDGKITGSDQTKIGNSIPTMQYGMFGNLRYGRFDLDLYFQGTGGYQIFYRGFEDTRGMKSLQNQETYVLNRWRSESQPGNGLVPRAIIGDPSQNNRPSSRMISNGDYFKLRQMAIGYSLPDKLVKKIDISGCRFYLSGTNIFTITPYTQFDPEYSGPNLTRGADWLNFPINPRTIVGGIKITL